MNDMKFDTLMKLSFKLIWNSRMEILLKVTAATTFMYSLSLLKISSNLFIKKLKF